MKKTLTAKELRFHLSKLTVGDVILWGYSEKEEGLEVYSVTASNSQYKIVEQKNTGMYSIINILKGRNSTTKLLLEPRRGQDLLNAIMKDEGILSEKYIDPLDSWLYWYFGIPENTSVFEKLDAITFQEWEKMQVGGIKNTNPKKINN